jgi:hypothetical protein
MGWASRGHWLNEAGCAAQGDKPWARSGQRDIGDGTLLPRAEQHALGWGAAGEFLLGELGRFPRRPDYCQWADPGGFLPISI